mmetsp:Transcript_3579/g.8071  ORF Transcript_3579/g.8071 Transcript_3579/m.8071 type:complete len:202 (-) Transcript_3579:101-706(-)
MGLRPAVRSPHTAAVLEAGVPDERGGGQADAVVPLLREDTRANVDPHHRPPVCRHDHTQREADKRVLKRDLDPLHPKRLGCRVVNVLPRRDSARHLVAHSRAAAGRLDERPCDGKERPLGERPRADEVRGGHRRASARAVGDAEAVALWAVAGHVPVVRLEAAPDQVALRADEGERRAEVRGDAVQVDPHVCRAVGRGESA